jgi:hypothetical protein
MAGQPRTRALAVELERRTRDSFEPVEGEPPMRSLDYVCLWIENGQTMKELAAELTRSLKFEVTYGQLRRFLDKTWGETECESKLSISRARASHSMAESALAIVDEPQDTNVGVSRASSRAKSRQWLAERYNRAAYGNDKSASVHISIGSLHLDALRSTVIPHPALVSVVTTMPTLPSEQLEISRVLGNGASEKVEDAQVLSIAPSSQADGAAASGVRGRLGDPEKAPLV